MMTWHIYKKEMKDVMRDRKTILLTVLMPLLMTIG